MSDMPTFDIQKEALLSAQAEYAAACDKYKEASLAYEVKENLTNKALMGLNGTHLAQNALRRAKEEECVAGSVRAQRHIAMKRAFGEVEAEEEKFKEERSKRFRAEVKDVRTVVPPGGLSTKYYHDDEPEEGEITPKSPDYTPNSPPWHSTASREARARSSSPLVSSSVVDSW